MWSQIFSTGWIIVGWHCHCGVTPILPAQMWTSSHNSNPYKTCILLTWPQFSCGLYHSRPALWKPHHSQEVSCPTVIMFNWNCSISCVLPWTGTNSRWFQLGKAYVAPKWSQISWGLWASSLQLTSATSLWISPLLKLTVEQDTPPFSFTKIWSHICFDDSMAKLLETDFGS